MSHFAHVPAGRSGWLPSRRVSHRLLVCGLLFGTLLALVGSVVPSAVQAEPELRATYRISGTNFLKAFRDVVSEPRQWTVRIRRQHPRTERWTDAALGVIVRSDGLVITKASEAIGPLRAKLSDRADEQVGAELIATDDVHDLALLQLDMTELDPLPTVKWARTVDGDLGDPRVGRWIVTPSIYLSPASVGIVSVPRRVIKRTELRGMLGVTFDRPAGNDQTGGGRIVELVVDGPADLSGLVIGDTIVSVNNVQTPIYWIAVNEIKKYYPGDVVALRVKHEDGDSETIRVRLAQPNTRLLEAREKRFDMMNTLGGDLSERRGNFPAAIQHDSVLDPHDCGGAAVDLDGNAIGINIARAGRTESLMLPADVSRKAIDRLLRKVR